MGWRIEHKKLKTLYSELGLEEQGKVQQFLGKTVADNLKRYVSFESGTQERMTRSTKGGTQVEIGVPYARFQAEGKVMVGIHSRSAWAKRGERKVVVGKNLRYHGGALRGSHPFERMKSDKRESILRQTANYARRLSGG